MSTRRHHHEQMSASELAELRRRKPTTKHEWYDVEPDPVAELLRPVSPSIAEAERYDEDDEERDERARRILRKMAESAQQVFSR